MNVMLVGFDQYLKSEKKSIFELSGTSDTNYLETSIQELFSVMDLVSLIVIIVVFAFIILFIKLVINSRGIVSNDSRKKEAATETLHNAVFYVASVVILIVVILGFLLTL